jgi:hypothetical protein
MVLFPGARGTPTRAGDISIDDGNVTEVYVGLTELPVLSGDDNGLLLSDDARLPKGAFIQKVETFVTKETAGTNANFNLGVVNASTMAIVDADGLLAAADGFNSGTDIGATNTYVKVDGAVTTEGGALIGTVLAETMFLCGAYDTAAFSAGILRVRVFWTMAPTYTV